MAERAYNIICDAYPEARCAQAGEDLSPEGLERAIRIIDDDSEWVCDRGFRALVEAVRSP